MTVRVVNVVTDLHRRRSVIVRRDADGEVVEEVRIDNDPVVGSEEAARQAEEAVRQARGWEIETTDGSCLQTGNLFEFRGTLVNTSGRTASYTVYVDLLDDSDTRVGDGIDFIPDLGPGDRASWKAIGSISGTVSAGGCWVRDVRRR